MPPCSALWTQKPRLSVVYSRSHAAHTGKWRPVAGGFVDHSTGELTGTWTPASLAISVSSPSQPPTGWVVIVGVSVPQATSARISGSALRADITRPWHGPRG